jgi:hypothetical protein
MIGFTRLAVAARTACPLVAYHVPTRKRWSQTESTAPIGRLVDDVAVSFASGQAAA